MELVYAMRDLGVTAPAAGDAADVRIHATISREIHRALNDERKPRWAVQQWHRSTAWMLATRRRVAVWLGVGLLAASTGAAAAAGLAPWTLLSRGSAGHLFTTNPAQIGFQRGLTPIPSSITDLGTISVPGVGAFRFWGAQTKNGEWCMAFKAPDGIWAGTQADANGHDDGSYNFSGNVPGCGITAPGVSQGGGFHWSMDEIGPFVAGNNSATIADLSAVIYGAIDNPAGATTVVNAATGASAPILDGHYFAIVEPRASLSIVQLEAVDSSGDVTARASSSTF